MKTTAEPHASYMRYYDAGFSAASAPTRGQRINRRAWLGAQLAALRTSIPELEKLARRTPPKTLAAERAKVEQAKVTLVAARAELASFEAEWQRLMAGENKGEGHKP